MAERVVVHGAVIGEAGKPVAGWVSLGASQPQRWLSRTVRIASDEGHEITVEDLGGEAIAPVTKREVVWSDFEKDELSSLLVRDAPAPDVEVKLHDAILRGGDHVSVWGDVTDRGYVGGDSQRGSVEGGITRIRAWLLSYGENAARLLDERKQAQLDEQRKEAEQAAKVGSRSTTDAAKKTKSKPVDTRAFEPIFANLPLFVAIAGLAVCAICAVATDRFHGFLKAAAVVAWAPIALDTLLLRRFRSGARAPTSLDGITFAYAIVALIVLFFEFSVTFGDPDPAKMRGAMFFTLIGACATGITVLIGWLLTRSRRRYLAILANAPPHADPTPDGAWGASVGRFSKQVLNVGQDFTTSGSGKNATVRSSAFCTVEPQAPLLRDGKSTIHVQVSEAAILTLANVHSSTGAKTSRSAHYIDATTPVIAAGRATDGVLRKGGEASLIVFASAPGTNVVVELAKLRRREWFAAALAVVGVACFVASFFVPAMPIAER
jgi:hypothetical protein